MGLCKPSVSFSKAAVLLWTKTFYLVNDNRLFQDSKIISVSSMVKNYGSIWKFHFAMFAYINSY